MIISRGRRYIFVHIPKTGGTSMALALESRALKDDLMLGDTPKATKRRRRLADAPSRGRLWKHSTLADIDGVVTPDEIAQMFCFTMVRNPWDRAVSYYHWLRTQNFEHDAVARAKQMDFDQFVRQPETMAAFSAAPAAQYMTDVTGKERCDSYIRLDHLAEDIAPLEAHLGFRLSLPHENRSTRRPDWRSYYTSASVEAVAQACQQDIQRFCFTFDG
ncbi:Type II secretory pathway, pullulanase PulA [Aliishimia ponticola]|uniref:Type II secretory pathway, pullulanase PulA n=1 Tax=Aliishimia ponticola TaxID=2499833 RepID=A0A4S4NG35_9RHOB|nr:sulfotransferase family 2 domain-containing protein [Aliishimia ponticola]THH37098.1 Type II secretory pathway, pullulanase PulA [Aliishimia ponticola]